MRAVVCIVVAMAMVASVAAQSGGEESFRRVAREADEERKKKTWGFLDRPTTPDSLLPNIKPVGVDRPKIVGNAADTIASNNAKLAQWNADWDRDQAAKKAQAARAADEASRQAAANAAYNDPSAVAQRNLAARQAKSDAIRGKKICGKDALVGAGRCMTSAFCTKTGGKPNPQAQCATPSKVCCVGGDAVAARAARTAKRQAKQQAAASAAAAAAARAKMKRGAQKKGGGLRGCPGGQCVAEKACMKNGGQANKGSSADACNDGAANKKASLVCCVGFNMDRAKQRTADKNAANAKPCQIAPTGTFKIFKGKKPGKCTPSNKAGGSCQASPACGGAQYKCCPV